MRTDIWLMILGMAIVTYLPRAIPAIFIEKMNFGPKMQKFLKLIPYTAMAALIFPGILLVDTEHLIIPIAGGIVAAVLAWKKFPTMVCVLAAIGVNFMLYLMWV